MTKILVSLVVVFFIGGVISTVFAADNAVDRGTVEVKESINQNAVTDVVVDSSGAPHLADKKTGKEITVKADGVVAGTTPRFLNGNEVTCVPINEVAGVVNGLASSAKASIVFHDAEGLETKIMPLSDFEDKGDFLSFDGGKIMVLLNSDSCNVASDKPNGSPMKEQGEKKTPNGIRGLGMNSIANVAAKLRQAYVSALTAADDDEGRHLQSDTSAQVIDSQAGSSGNAVPPDSPGGGRKGYIISFANAGRDGEPPAAKCDALARAHGGEVGRVYRNALNGCSMSLPEAALNGLRNNPAVALVEEDGVATVSAAASWGLDRINQYDIPLDGIATKVNAQGVKVYILDTGLKSTHNDFAGMIDSTSSCHHTEYTDSLNDGNGHGYADVTFSCRLDLVCSYPPIHLLLFPSSYYTAPTLAPRPVA